MKTLLLSAALGALCLASPAPAATPLPDVDPALWQVKDDDTTIYLFGTFHAMDGKSDWFNDEVKTAFDKSEELVIEAIIPEDQAKMQPVVMKYALDKSGKTLTSRLSPDGQKKLAEALKAMGAPANAFDGYKPFFAAMILTMNEMGKQGMAHAKGTEAALAKAAKEAGKPVGELENVEFQMAMFDRIPDKDQVEMLEGLLDGLDTIPKESLRMLTAWNTGDAAGFKTIMDESDKQGPAAYKVIFSDRNATWADWIDKRLDKPGTVFLAVGTGHLAGRDSVQEWLSKRQIAVSRVE